MYDAMKKDFIATKNIWIQGKKVAQKYIWTNITNI